MLNMASKLEWVARSWRTCATATVAGVLATSLMAPTQVQAEEKFPSTAVTIIPFGISGGPIGNISRALAEQLQKRWGQPVVVDAKPGASGIIAADYVARARPDGHTMMVTLSISHINVPILHEKLPFDPVKSFTPVTQLAAGGPVLVAPVTAPYSTLQEFIEYARKNQGMSYGTWGTGSTAHLYGELLSRNYGLDLLHVPYKGEANAHIDMLGGSLDLAWANPATALALLGDGRIKVLGLAASKRLSALPDVQTFAEQDVPGFEMDSWIGVYGPANLPEAVTEEWLAALGEAMQSPTVLDLMNRMGFEPLVNTPEEFMASYEADYPRVAELIKAAGVTLQ